MERQNPLDDKFFSYYELILCLVCWSGLFLKPQETFMRLIFKDRFWFVHKPVINLAKTLTSHTIPNKSLFLFKTYILFVLLLSLPKYICFPLDHEI